MEPVPDILIVKTAALGDVLRTTSILPGLHRVHPGARVTWLTAPGAVDLVRTHPSIARVVAIDTQDAGDVAAKTEDLVRTRFARVISLDDELPLCALAARVPADRLSGAFLRPDGQRAYTADVSPWFDMGLLSVHGKARADELKIQNHRSQPEIYAAMLGIEMGKPELHLTGAERAFRSAFRARHALVPGVPLIGLNTGAGGRWVSKQLSPERTVELARLLHARFDGGVRFLVLGGESESDRNRSIIDGLWRAGLAAHTIDAGVHNPLLQFAALVSLCDLLVTSDSLALHMAIAQDVHCVAFFAPTSAAEIELYGLGEKVQSTAADYCSYKPDADNASITPERLAAAVSRVASALRSSSRPA
jgi:heptosyltransferase II